MNRKNKSEAPAFPIDTRLEAEGLARLILPVSTLLLRNEARLPWVVLVPRIEKASALHDVPAEVGQGLMEEINGVSDALKGASSAHQINVAAFGNVVRQLHIHVVARFEDDPFWPGSAIGVGPAEPYPEGVPLPDWWEVFCAALRRKDLISP